MKDFLGKYSAVKIETSEDEGKLTLDKAKERILKILNDNIKNFKDNTWNKSNRMNKLMVDTDNNTIFNLRLGGKRILRYSLDLLDVQQKMIFLADISSSIVHGEFDEDILGFLAKEVEKTAQRKKEANERRRQKKQAEREKKAVELRKQAEEARLRTLAAAEPLLNKEFVSTVPIYQQL